jgi:hypothetical protein
MGTNEKPVQWLSSGWICHRQTNRTSLASCDRGSKASGGQCLRIRPGARCPWPLSRRFATAWVPATHRLQGSVLCLEAIWPSTQSLSCSSARRASTLSAILFIIHTVDAYYLEMSNRPPETYSMYGLKSPITNFWRSKKENLASLTYLHRYRKDANISVTYANNSCTTTARSLLLFIFLGWQPFLFAITVEGGPRK